jgi:hypothetical protein
VCLLFCFFLFFLTSVELAVGPPVMADRTVVEAFSLGAALRASDSSWGGAASGMFWAGAESIVF